MSKFKAIPIGSVFTRLTVIGLPASGICCSGRAIMVPCRCNCGKITKVARFNLLSKRVKSCGCLKFDRSWAITHGQTKTRAYSSWSGMKSRCLNPKFHKYASYGARGITICKRWLNFSNFYKDMGQPPDGHTLHRIDNDGNYNPKNCKWATIKEQARNAGHNVIWRVDGIRSCVAAHCERYGIRQQLVWSRVNNGWSKRDALSTPVRKCARRAN